MIWSVLFSKACFKRTLKEIFLPLKVKSRFVLVNWTPLILTGRESKETTFFAHYSLSGESALTKSIDYEQSNQNEEHEPATKWPVIFLVIRKRRIRSFNKLRFSEKYRLNCDDESMELKLDFLLGIDQL